MRIRPLLHEVDPYEGFEPWPPVSVGWNLGGDSPLFRELIEQVRPQTVIEVGTWLGGSAVTMGTAMKELGIDGEILCIDSWQGPFMFWNRERFRPGYEKLMLKHGCPQVYYQFLSNVVHAGLQDIITPLPQSCDVAFQILEMFEVKADLIYIDASHEERFVYRDVSEYAQLLRDGESVIFGDDYERPDSEVGRAVHRVFGDKIRTYPYNEQTERFWIHQLPPALAGGLSLSRET